MKGGCAVTTCSKDVHRQSLSSLLGIGSPEVQNRAVQPPRMQVQHDQQLKAHHAGPCL